MKKQPQRMCVTCKTRRDKKDLLRVVFTEQGDAIVDLTGKASGRGAYLCRNAQCIETELKAHRLAKGLKKEIGKDDLKALAEELLSHCEQEEGSAN